VTYICLLRSSRPPLPNPSPLSADALCRSYSFPSHVADPRRTFALSPWDFDHHTFSSPSCSRANSFLPSSPLRARPYRKEVYVLCGSTTCSGDWNWSSLKTSGEKVASSVKPDSVRSLIKGVRPLPLFPASLWIILKLIDPSHPLCFLAVHCLSTIFALALRISRVDFLLPPRLSVSARVHHTGLRFVYLLDL
jgi:hypothetical protein